MKPAVVKPVGPAGSPWAVVYEGTSNIVHGTSFHKLRSAAHAEADSINLRELRAQEGARVVDCAEPVNAEDVLEEHM